MSLPASSDCSLDAGSGRTLVGAGATVAGAEADSVEGPVEAGDTLADASADALAGALADALADAVAEEDDTCAVKGAYFACPLRAAPALSSLPASIAGGSVCLSGWFSLFTFSVLRSSDSTLRTTAISEGAWETVGSCTTETAGRTSALMVDVR